MNIMKKTHSNGDICLSGAFIQATAQNLKNLLGVAQKVGLTPPSIEEIPLTSIQNALCASFGFTSVKGMLVKLDGVEAQELNIYNLPILNLVPALTAKNQNASEGDIAQVDAFAGRLYCELVMLGQPKALTKLLSHIKPFKMHRMTAQAYHAHNYRSYQHGGMLLNYLLQAAMDSVAMSCLWLEGYSGSTSIATSRIFKTAAGNKGLDPQEIEVVRDIITPVNRGSLLNYSSITVNKIQVGYSSYADGFHYGLGFGRRTDMMRFFRASPKYEKSLQLLRNLITNKSLSDGLIHFNISSQSESDNPNHPDFAIMTLWEISSALHVVIEMLFRANEGAVMDSFILNKIQVKEDARIEWDAQGLVTYKGVIDLFDYIASKSNSPTLINASCLSVNALYWAMYAMVSELLVFKGTPHALAAKDYIDHCYDYNASNSIVWEMSCELNGDAFLRLKENFQLILRKNINQNLNNIMGKIKETLFIADQG